jgi:AraC family L-rhamnose operon regulatory protein RhaS
LNKQQHRRTVTFRSSADLFHADTCEPLEAAASRGEVRLAAFSRGSYPGKRLPASDVPEVRSVGCWDARGIQTWGLDWHRNEGIEFTYLAAGQLPFAVDRRTVTLEPGDITITRPWQRHRVGNPRVPASRLIWLILDVGVRRPNQAWRWPKWLLLSPAKRQRLTHQLRHNEQPAWRANRKVARCFESIGAAVAGKPTEEKLTQLKVLINEMLIALASLLQEKRPRLDTKLSSAERTVKLFLAEVAVRCDEPWTLEAMAKQCGLGRTHFSHYCRKLTNRTPLDHLAECRIQRATTMLKQQPASRITDVAFDCGFQSSQYFASVFARRMSCSPRAFRRQ